MDARAARRRCCSSRAAPTRPPRSTATRSRCCPNYARAEAGLGAVAVARGNLAAGRALVRARRLAPAAARHRRAARRRARGARRQAAGANEAYALVGVEQALFVRAGGNADLETALFDASHPGTTRAPRSSRWRARRWPSARRSTATTRSPGRSTRPAMPPGAAAGEAREPPRHGRSAALLAPRRDRRLRRRSATWRGRALRRALARTPRFHPLDAPAARAAAGEARVRAKWHSRRVPLGLLAPRVSRPGARCARARVAERPPARQLHGQPVHAARPRRSRRLRALRARHGRDPDVPAAADASMPTATAASRRPRPRARARGSSRSSRRICGCVADGRPVRLVLEDGARRFPHGQGGLSTTRLDARFRAVGLTLGDSPHTLTALQQLRDRPRRLARAAGRPRRRGRRALHGRLGRRPHARAHALPDRSAALAARRRAPRRRSAALGSGGLAVQAIPARDASAPAAASSSAKSDGGFVSLIESGGELTLVGALVGARRSRSCSACSTPSRRGTARRWWRPTSRARAGSARHALILGGTVTITHTAGVFALGIVTLSLSQFIVPGAALPVAEPRLGRDGRRHRRLRDPRPPAPLAARRAAARPPRPERPTVTATSMRTTTATTTTARTTMATITGTATRTPRPSELSLRSLVGARRLRRACCRAPRRSSCCSRRSRCTASPSASR